MKKRLASLSLIHSFCWLILFSTATSATSTYCCRKYSFEILAQDAIELYREKSHLAKEWQIKVDTAQHVVYTNWVDFNNDGKYFQIRIMMTKTGYQIKIRRRTFLGLKKEDGQSRQVHDRLRDTMERLIRMMEVS
jgi:hypothetical protein